MTRTHLLALILMGCRVDAVGNGTAVGNPTGLDVSLATPKSFEVTSATLPVTTLYATPCGGEELSVRVDRTLILAENTPIELPDGPLCRLVFTPAGPLSLAGVRLGTTQETVSVSVLLPELRFEPTGGHDAARLLVQIGDSDWAEGLPAGDLQPDSPEAAALAERWLRATALYADLDADGVVDPQEPLLAYAQLSTREDTGAPAPAEEAPAEEAPAEEAPVADTGAPAPETDSPPAELGSDTPDGADSDDDSDSDDSDDDDSDESDSDDSDSDSDDDVTR